MRLYRKVKNLVGMTILIVLGVGCAPVSPNTVKDAGGGAPLAPLTTVSPSPKVFSLPTSPSPATPLSVTPQVGDQSEGIFGISVMPLNQSGGLNYFDDIVNWMRYSFSWSSVEPQPGARNWNAVQNFEQALLNTTVFHNNVVVTVESTPAWALKPGYSCGAVAPDQLPLLGNFMYDLVSRYSQPPYNVHYWEMWNEPDVAGFLGCWGDPSDPYYGGGYYAEMLKAVYSRIKAADPQAQVLVGGLLLDCDPRTPQPNCSGQWEYKTTSSKFMEGILKNGGGNYFDGVSFHAYDYYSAPGQYSNPNWFSSQTTGPSALAKASYLRELLTEYDVPDKFLMNTEIALLVCSKDESDASCLNDGGQRELAKSSYIVQAYVLAMADGWKANIWYSSLGWRGSGLLNPDLSPRPSYGAYKFASSELNKASYYSNGSSPEVKAYDFIKDNQQIWVLWSADGDTHTLTLPEITWKEFDMFGNPVNPGATLQVDWRPIYVVLGQ